MGYLGVDQFGGRWYLGEHPRKDLMEQIGVKKASKMYIDKKNGEVKHIGYVVGKMWVTLYQRVERPA